MKSMDSDKMVRVYTRLKALRDNLPDSFQVNEKYVSEYHSLVNELSTITGSALDEFNVSSQEIKPKLVAVALGGGGRQYSNDCYCERPLLLAKIDALLSYFQITFLSEDKQRIGFRLTEE